MIVCSYKNCYTRRLTFSSTTFFRLPNDSRRNLWIENSGNRDLDNLKPSQIRYFCERHFEKKDIRHQFNRNLLRSEAIPKSYYMGMAAATREEFISVDDTVDTNDIVMKKDNTALVAPTISDDEDEIQFNVCFAYESESPTIDVGADETETILEEVSEQALNIDNDKASIDYDLPEDDEPSILASRKEENPEKGGRSDKCRLSGPERKRLKAFPVKGLSYDKASEMAQRPSEQCERELNRKRMRFNNTTLKDNGPKKILVKTNAHGASKKPAMAYTSTPFQAVTVEGVELKMETPTLFRTESPSTVKMGIIPKGFPDTIFNTDELRTIQKAILCEILRDFKGNAKPNFTGCSFRSGWMAFNCGDNSTANWLREIVPKLVPWDGAQLKVVPEETISQPHIYLGCFPLLLGVKVDDILKMVEGQNTDLNTSDWRLLNYVRRGYVIELTMAMTALSANKLKQRNDTVAFGFNRVQLKPKANEQQRAAPTATVIVKTSTTANSSAVATKTAGEPVAVKTASTVESPCCSKDASRLPQVKLVATSPDAPKQNSRAQETPRSLDAVAAKLVTPLRGGRASGTIELRCRNGDRRFAEEAALVTGYRDNHIVARDRRSGR